MKEYECKCVFGYGCACSLVGKHCTKKQRGETHLLLKGTVNSMPESHIRIAKGIRMYPNCDIVSYNFPH
jgi:hypothetical protein